MFEGIKAYIIEVFLTVSVAIGVVKLIVMEWKGLIEACSAKKERDKTPE